MRLTATKTQGYVVFLDIYGFSFLKYTKKIFGRLMKCHRHVEHIIDDALTKAFFFSDSIFILYKAPKKENRIQVLRQIKADIENIMGFYLKNDFALRGSLGYGEVKFNDRLIIGKAAVNAYINEQKISLPIFWIPYNELDDPEREAFGKYEDNIVDLKSPYYKMYGYQIMPYPIEEFKSYVEKQRHFYLLNGPPEPAKAWDKALIYINNQYDKGEPNV